jgi:hypothetical protein
MNNFDYKKYSLENLENWMHDALSSAEASPHEIYATIREVVQDNYNFHKENAQRCLGLLELLSGHRPANLDNEMQKTGECERTSGVKRWILPVEETKIAETDETEYFVSFPDDLLEAANLKESDQVEWIDQGDGSYLLRKVSLDGEAKNFTF